MPRGAPRQSLALLCATVATLIFVPGLQSVYTGDVILRCPNNRRRDAEINSSRAKGKNE